MSSREKSSAARPEEPPEPHDSGASWSAPAPSSCERRALRARHSRERTVPAGNPKATATSLSGRPPQACNNRTSRCSAGSEARASATRGANPAATCASGAASCPIDGGSASKREPRASMRCSARQCSRTRLLAMPKSHARGDPRLGSKLCLRRKAVAKVSAAMSSANGAPTRRAMKRWTTLKLTSKQCSKPAKSTMGTRSAPTPWRLFPLTTNDCHSGGNLLRIGTKCRALPLSLFRPPWPRPRGVVPSGRTTQLWAGQAASVSVVSGKMDAWGQPKRNARWLLTCHRRLVRARTVARLGCERTGGPYSAQRGMGSHTH